MARPARLREPPGKDAKDGCDIGRLAPLPASAGGPAPSCRPARADQGGTGAPLPTPPGLSVGRVPPPLSRTGGPRGPASQLALRGVSHPSDVRRLSPP